MMCASGPLNYCMGTNFWMGNKFLGGKQVPDSGFAPNGRTVAGPEAQVVGSEGTRSLLELLPPTGRRYQR